MNFYESITLGIIQGITEFLPISSSGHLFLVEKYLGIAENLNFEIALHFASLLAILVFFQKEVWSLLKNFSLLFIGKKTDEGDYALKILVATLITIPIALFIKKTLFDTGNITEALVAGTLIITGILIISAERLRSFFSLYAFNKNQLSWAAAICLGFVQGLTVIPGISRSGTTIAFLILIGLNRKFSAKTSFFLALPTIFGAMVFSLNEANWNIPIGNVEIIGCIFSFLTALIAIKFMLKMVEKNWIWFAPYCLLLGFFLIIKETIA